MPNLKHIFAAPAFAALLALAPAGATLADGHTVMTETAVSIDDLPEKKHTEAGLYVTATEAAEVLATRDDVVLIDVRTPEETMLVGYPMAADVNIPVKMIDPDHPFNARKGRYEMTANPDFLRNVKAFLDEADPSAAIVMCRSGGRSAAAVNMLTEAGINLPLYSMVDGFEGDKSPEGKRTVNGWKNVGGAWTYKIREGFWPAAMK